MLTGSNYCFKGCGQHLKQYIIRGPSKQATKEASACAMALSGHCVSLHLGHIIQFDADSECWIVTVSTCCRNEAVAHPPRAPGAPSEPPTP